jgi:hypothetical protein
MILVVLIVGIVLIVAAVRNTHASLFSALIGDVPQYAVWAAAILAVGAIGFVPVLKPVSRGLLALILLVLILKNYQAILTGFQSAWQGAAAQGAAGAAAGSSASTAIAPVRQGDTSGVNSAGIGGTNFSPFGSTSGVDPFSFSGSNQVFTLDQIDQALAGGGNG